MKQFYLAEITTHDKLIHQGLFFLPKKPGKKAILWVHGLTDNFYGDLTALEELSKKCDEETLGFASFTPQSQNFQYSVTSASHYALFPVEPMNLFYLF